MFYRQRRDTNRFFRSNNSISHTNYFRILTLASVDLLFTLPTGIANLVIATIENNEAYEGHIPFYNGWNLVHSDWVPLGFSYDDLKSSGAAALAQVYATEWTSPVFAFIIFGLFGLTAEARATYWRAICFVGKWFGWKPAPQKATEKPTLGTMEFGARPQEISLDAEMGCVRHFRHRRRCADRQPRSSRPSFINFEPVVANNVVNGAEKIGRAPEASLEHDSFDSVMYV